MKRAKQFLVGVLAVTSGGLWIAACGSIPIVPTTDCGSYAGVSYWHKEEPPQVTVCLDDDQSGVLQFKDDEGNTVPGGGNISAGGCLTVSEPPGAAYVDWLVSPEPGAVEQELAATAPLLHWMRPVGVLPSAGREYLIGCTPLWANPTDTVRSYEIKVIAGSPHEAKAKVHALLDQGPGTPVPPGVTVGKYIEAEVVGSDLVIRSSLADRFAAFRIEIDGNPVADLESGLNVEVTPAGHRWRTLTATLPLASLPESMTVTLRQQAEHDPDEVEVRLSFV